MQPMTRFNTSATTFWRQQLWLGLLVVGALASSYIFACATPFAALATAAALTLNRTQGVVFILATWLANQLIGYGILGYPQDAYSFTWGAVIGAAALVSLGAARITASRLTGLSEWMRISTCFAASLIASQLFMYAAALTPLGGIEGFSSEIIREVVTINAVAMVAIYAFNLLAVSVGLLPAAAKSAA